MAEITCSVVKDLLPLYVDDALSPDSRAVVEEHLEGCEGCTEYYHLLKTWERDHIKMKSADDKAVLKKIKGRIKRRRLAAILATAVCVAALAAGVFYGTVLHETYIPYEDSGIYVTEDVLKTNRNYYKNSGIYSPDGEACFIFMTTTVFTDMTKDRTQAGIPIWVLDKKSRTTTEVDDYGHVTEQVCREIYYVSEEKAKQFLRVMRWTSGREAEEVEEMKADSVLVWSDKG